MREKIESEHGFDDGFVNCPFCARRMPESRDDSPGCCKDCECDGFGLANESDPEPPTIADDTNKLVEKWLKSNPFPRDKNRAGFVYIVANPAWPEYVKIGMAIDTTKRLVGYNVNSPHKDFSLVYSAAVADRAYCEEQILDQMKPYRAKGEWFKISPDRAIVLVGECVERFKTVIGFGYTGPGRRWGRGGYKGVKKAA